MKKALYLVSVIVLITISSCSSSSFEQDGRKMAKLMCKEQQLSQKAMSGDENAKKELEKVRDERDKLKEELSEKYKEYRGDEKRRKQANDIVQEEMAKCK